jgi:hypothetical protein
MEAALVFLLVLFGLAAERLIDHARQRAEYEEAVLDRLVRYGCRH